MDVRTWRVAIAAVTLLAVGGCSHPFGRQYEYEEQLYLSIDGSASIVIDSSVAALVALRGLALDPNAPVDRDAVRRMFETAGCHVTAVGRPWSRHDRNFVQISIRSDDVRTAGTCRPLSWSQYVFESDQPAKLIHFHQNVGAPAPGTPAPVNWDGTELVAFRLHLPSQIRYHNVRRLEDDTTGDIDRGNILTWEQRLTDRRAGKPLEIDVHMDPVSILYNTLWMFLGAFLGAVLLLTAIVWWLVRKGRKQARPRRA